MNIQYLDPHILEPYQNNARRHPERQVEALALAITEFGFDQPIVVGPDMVIIKGHGRLQAALKLGLTTVPVVVREITDNEARLLRVADNEAVSDQWDLTALQGEMAMLGDLGFNMQLTGFSMEEVETILAELPVATTTVEEVDPLVTSHQCGNCGYRW